MSRWKENIEMLPCTKVILPQNNPKKPYYNPSICWYKDKLIIAIRSSTWTRNANGGFAVTLGKLHTDIMLGEVDPETLRVSKLRKLKYAGKVHPFVQNIGLEDARLFVRGDKLYAVGVCMSKEDRRGESVHIAQGEIIGDELIFESLLTKPYPDRIEKNWTPPSVATDKFDFIYSATQTIKDGVLTGESYGGLTHGGSQAIPWEDGWLSFVHKVHRLERDYDGFHQYVNYVMKYNKSGIATDISQGFLLFDDNRIEFVAGLVEAGDGNLLISLGVGDDYCVLAKIDPKVLRFQPFDPKEEPIKIQLATGPVSPATHPS